MSRVNFNSCQVSLGVCLVVIVLIINANTVEADEVPAFFLKIAKNMPRVGRRDKFEDFFLKSAKDLPRIGRRDVFSPITKESTLFDSTRLINEPYKRMIKYEAPGNPETVAWEHFPLAIEGPPELWRTLASYTNDKYGNSADDIDNEVWQRSKRMDIDINEP